MHGRQGIILLFLLLTFCSVKAQQSASLDSMFQGITKSLNDATESMKQNLKSSIVVYNNTPGTIYYAYAMYDYGNNYWKTVGWYTIDSYQEEEWDLNEYTGNIYIYGHQVLPDGISEKFWGGDSYFCIDPQGPFEIRFADRVNCEKENRLGFVRKSITEGKNKWTFHP